MPMRLARAALLSERALAVDLSRARSLQLEITTAEGDRVMLTRSDTRSLQLAAYRAERLDGGGVVVDTRQSRLQR